MIHASLASTACVGAILLVTGCAATSTSQEGRFFQYASTDGAVVAEYDALDAATCSMHLKNLQTNNSHGANTLRCSSSSAEASLPTRAVAADARGNPFNFRFANLEQCRRMLPAITSGGSISRNCS